MIVLIIPDILYANISEDSRILVFSRQARSRIYPAVPESRTEDENAKLWFTSLIFV
jgi:hypothetical protein